jgi:trk system potassium uptake protein TrkH
MTFGSFVILSKEGKLSEARKRIGQSAFSLPEALKIGDFIRSVVIFTFVCELIGALALWGLFSAQGVEGALWKGVFHSVSAFCTAGFSLFSNSLEAFSGVMGINAVLSILSLLGGIGFIVWTDVFFNLTGQRTQMTFTSKIILSITFWFLLLGTILFALTEPSMQAMDPLQKLQVGFFQVMTASTTVGFNSVPIGSLSSASIMLLLFFMIFGASPSGTGGGLKSTTFSALFGLVKSTLKGRSTVRFRKRTIPSRRLQMATASFVYYMGVLGLAVFLLCQVENFAFQEIVFEAASALGTVGLSMGITGALAPISKMIFIVLMLMGRVGVLTFAIAMTFPDETPEEEKDNDLVM